jgi:hypothetical protein
MKELFITKLFLFSAGVSLISMMTGSLVAQVASNVVWLYIDGISICVALYSIVGGCHPGLLASARGQ